MKKHFLLLLVAVGALFLQSCSLLNAAGRTKNGLIESVVRTIGNTTGL